LASKDRVHDYKHFELFLGLEIGGKAAQKLKFNLFCSFVDMSNVKDCKVVSQIEIIVDPTMNVLNFELNFLFKGLIDLSIGFSLIYLWI